MNHSEHQSPGPEFQTPQEVILQNFEGRADAQHLALGQDTLIVDMLTATLAKGGILTISGEETDNPVLPQIFGEATIAEIELGGSPAVSESDEPFPVQRLFVQKINKNVKHDPEMTNILNAIGTDKDEDGFLITVADGFQKGVRGFTFIRKTTGNGVIGRNSKGGNLTWVTELGQLPKSTDWSPIDPNNTSISRHQLTLGTTKTGDLLISGQSDNSLTVVRTRASASHHNVLHNKNK